MASYPELFEPDGIWTRRGRNGKGNKEVSCFHASTRVRMFTKETGAPEYKKTDKLVKGDQLWTRRYRRNLLGPSQGHVSTVECVMTFACPPDGQPMVEVEGNLEFPDPGALRSQGKWSMVHGRGTDTSRTRISNKISPYSP